jgi:hypothetical protein
MVTKVQGSRPQSIQPAKTEAPKPPPKAEPQAPTKNTGWAPKAGGAGKVGGAQGSASQVKLLAATIDSLPGTEKMVAPKGYSVVTGEDKRSLTASLPDGRTAKFDWDSQTLSAKGPDGKTVVLADKDEAGFKGYASDFNDNFKGISKEDAANITMPEWDSSRSYGGVGAAGKMLSVSENVGDYTGGAHPNYAGQLQTYDLSTGKKVTLDQLVSKDQLASIVSTIQKQLPKLTGSDGVDGGSFQPYGDINKMVSENFALSTDAKGNAQITVAWMSGVHAMGDLAATFTFAAPTDAAFKAKIGLE